MWALVAFGWGLRHGADWDHVAAISDVTVAEGDGRRAVRLATAYAAGHATVLLVLGAIAVVVGAFVSVPVDGAFGRIAGLTLVVLGIAVLVHMARVGAAVPVTSRTMVVRVAQRWWQRHRNTPLTELLVDHDHEHDVDGPHEHDPLVLLTEKERAAALRQPKAPAAPAPGRHRHPHRHRVPLPADPTTVVGTRTAVTVGVLHGVGAATPTQVVVLASAAGAASTLAGVGYLLAFVAGLFTTNTAIAVAGALGRGLVGRSSRVVVGANLAAATLSIAVGAALLTGAAMPPLASG